MLAFLRLFVLVCPLPPFLLPLTLIPLSEQVEALLVLGWMEAEQLGELCPEMWASHGHAVATAWLT